MNTNDITLNIENYIVQELILGIKSGALDYYNIPHEYYENHQIYHLLKQKIIDHICKNNLPWHRIPGLFLKDEVIAMELIRQNGHVIHLLPPVNRNNKNVALFGVKIKGPQYINYFNQSLKNDPDIIKAMTSYFF